MSSHRVHFCVHAVLSADWAMQHDRAILRLSFSQLFYRNCAGACQILFHSLLCGAWAFNSGLAVHDQSHVEELFVNDPESHAAESHAEMSFSFQSPF